MTQDDIVNTLWDKNNELEIATLLQEITVEMMMKDIKHLNSKEEQK